VATEETFDPELLSHYRAFAVGHSSMLTRTELKWVEEFAERGGVVVMGESANGGPNLLQNASFEEIDEDSGLPTGWGFYTGREHFTCSEEGSFDGDRHLRFEREGTEGQFCCVRQTVSIQPGILYSYSFWARTDGSHYAGYIRKGSNYGSVIGTAAPARSENGWTQYVALVHAPEDETSLWLTLEQWLPGVTEYDGVEFRPARVAEALKHGLGQPLVTLDGPHWVRAYVREKGDTTVVHLLNYHVARPDGPTLELEDVENLTVTLRLPPGTRMTSVRCLTPDLALNTEADELLANPEEQSQPVEWESQASEDSVIITMKVSKLRIWNMFILE